MAELTWERFWDQVQKGAPTQCWEWRGPRHRTGYGRSGSGKTNHRYAHRVAWMLTHEQPIPAGMFVCHRCDNPPCCNPVHLFLGTCLDNIRDRDSKGRAAFGRRNGAYTRPDRLRARALNGRAKLTDSDVSIIRILRGEGQTLTAIALRFGVTHSAVGRILNGQRWRGHAQC